MANELTCFNAGTFEEVGNFYVNSQGKYELSLNRSLFWPHEKAAPKDKPMCGFYNDACVKRRYTPLGFIPCKKTSVDLRRRNEKTSALTKG